MAVDLLCIKSANIVKSLLFIFCTLIKQRLLICKYLVF